MLVLNLNFTSAASVNTLSTSIPANSVENSGVNPTKTTYTHYTSTAKAAYTNESSINSIGLHKLVNSNIAAGSPTAVGGLSVAKLKNGLSRVQAFYKKNGRLPNYVTIGTKKITIKAFKVYLTKAGLKFTLTTKSSVKGLTLAQIKEGLARVQSFYNQNGRLPNYVTYGTKKITIKTFKIYLTKAGLKIKTNPKPINKPDTSSVSALALSLTKGVSQPYSKAVKIFNWVRDNISYSFYYNSKYGASGTLKYRTANCCDTSHLLVALARDVGITARYVHGTCQFSDGTFGHVWSQFLINGKWYNADGISYKNSFGVIKNWNTATYKLHGYYTTLPF